jgi:hypothetical protein
MMIDGGYRPDHADIRKRMIGFKLSRIAAR